VGKEICPEVIYIEKIPVRNSEHAIADPSYIFGNLKRIGKIINPAANDKLIAIKTGEEKNLKSKL